MEVGVEWLVDALGCRSEKLADMEVLRKLCGDILDGLDLRVVGEGRWHQFPPPGGITALFLLTESHLSLHTYPECGIATFNLYCCRPRPCWQWEERLAEHLNAKKTLIRKLVRGSMQTEEGAQSGINYPDRQEGLR